MATAQETFPRPTGSLKRKLNDPTSTFVQRSGKKAAKLNENGSPHSTPNGHGLSSARAAYIQDERPEEDNDQEAGPAPPSEEEEEDDEVEDDEEGRFFGGGVSSKEKDVLDYIEKYEDGQPEDEINLTWLKKTALTFERKINKNAELRAKYEDEPMKFVSSEADLDSEIKNLTLLSGHPDLYKDFVRSGCCDSLVGLLAHDNTDIAIAASEVIAELTDEDTGAPPDQWSALIQSMLKAELVDLLVSNLHRLDEANESDASGVYHVLNVVENLLSDSTSAAAPGTESKLLEWLLKRVQRIDQTSPNQVDQNRQYAAEILAILAQNHERNASQLVSLGAVDAFLQILSTWRRRDPDKGSDEKEFAENVFDCLVTLVKDASGCEEFLQDEGVELCMIMLKESQFLKRGALRVLDHAAASTRGQALCERLVDAGGLKQLFTTFMKSKKLERDSKEHILGLFASMLRNLPGGSAARIRTLAKFVENEYEKCKRLLELRKDYINRLAAVEVEIQSEKTRIQLGGDNEEEWWSRRVDAGLFPSQTISIILAWLIAEDDGARQYILDKLKGEQEQGLVAIRRDLQEQLDGIEVEANGEEVSTREVLSTLLKCLS